MSCHLLIIQHVLQGTGPEWDGMTLVTVISHGDISHNTTCNYSFGLGICPNIVNRGSITLWPWTEHYMIICGKQGKLVDLKEMCASVVGKVLTLNVRGPSYPGLTRSISLLLMTWGCKELGHWYWLCKIGKSLSYMRKDFNFFYDVNVEEWCKMLIHFYD